MASKRIMTSKRKKRRNNVSRKGGMYNPITKISVNRPLIPKATPTDKSMATTTNKLFEYLVMPDKSVKLHKMTTNENKIIEDGINFIQTVFVEGGKTELFKLGWEKEFRKLVINLYSHALESNTQNGGMITEAGITRKPKFRFFNYGYILASIIFGIASIMIMASLLSTVDSLINFDMKSIIENRQISAKMKKILCDAFSKGMDSERMDAMAKIWYALSCVVAPMRPDSVTYYETKIFNVVQHIVTNLMITTSKEAVDLCVVQSKNTLLNFANQFTAAFTGSANCMSDVAARSGQHKIQEIIYITDAVKTSFYQQGKSLYYLPMMMITALQFCNYYRLEYIEAVKQFRIANEAYESALMGINPTNEVPTNTASTNAEQTNANAEPTNANAEPTNANAAVVFKPRSKSNGRGKIRVHTEE